jgi:hypothetical protein
MSNLKTSYEFTLPRGYVDEKGQLHRTGTMRLATARDELAPLRDPTVSGPDDPRLTVLVLTRVVEELGDIKTVTPFEIEGLFAVDLAFLQDFYGVINFGSQEEYDALLATQEATPLLGSDRAGSAPPSTASDSEAPTAAVPDAARDATPTRPPLRAAVEELPRRAQ